MKKKEKKVNNYAVDRLVRKRLEDEQKEQEYYRTKEGQEELRKKKEMKLDYDDSKIAETMKLRDDESSDFRRKLRKKLIEREKKLKQNK
jgi:hypothetical protein